MLRIPGRVSKSRSAWLLLAVVMTATLASCGVDPQTTLAPQSDFADKIQFLLKLTFFMGVGVFVVVESALFFVVFRFRRRRGDEAIPRQIHGNNRLEVTWTIIPAILLVIIAIPTTQTIFDTQQPAPPSSLHIRVIGHQWWWEFQYTDPAYQIRTPDGKTVPLTTANEVHMPVGRTVAFDLESADVQHGFWLPRLGGKRDVIPNHVNHLWWTPNEIGVTPGQCTQFCGASHANMRMLAFVQSKADFDTWAQQQMAPPATPSGGAAAQGLSVFKSQPCVGCHTIEGVSSGTIGPNLTHVASRTTIASGTLKDDPQDLAAWLHDPPGEKPGSIMPNLHLTDQQVNQLVAYLQTLK